MRSAWSRASFHASTDAGEPVVWAFDVRYAAFSTRDGLHRPPVAADVDARIYMLVPEDEGFDGMLMAKAILMTGESDALKPHRIVELPRAER